MEVQEAAVAALAAAHAAEDLVAAVSAEVRVPEAALEAHVPAVSEVHLVITIIITVPILVGDSVRAVITAVAVGDALAR